MYTILDHTADTGIEARADELATLIARLATGMFELMGTPAPGSLTGEVQIAIDAADPVDLVFESLSELLYQSEVQDLVLREFAAELSDDGRMLVEARGARSHDVELDGPPIKAVTYHDLVVEQRPSGWYGRVYFDV